MGYAATREGCGSVRTGVQMPKGYVILTEDIHDAAGMAEYANASMPSIIEHDAKVLVVDENVEVLEGRWHGTRTVIVEFESVEAARAWYNSPSYRKAQPLRAAASTCNVVILSGFELPGR
jgi:uncharacterized protein (DUF1330 family)